MRELRTKNRSRLFVGRPPSRVLKGGGSEGEAVTKPRSRKLERERERLWMKCERLRAEERFLDSCSSLLVWMDDDYRCRR